VLAFLQLAIHKAQTGNQRAHVSTGGSSNAIGNCYRGLFQCTDHNLRCDPTYPMLLEQSLDSRLAELAALVRCWRDSPQLKKPWGGCIGA
jgi:hypothetical protein